MSTRAAAARRGYCVNRAKLLHLLKIVLPAAILLLCAAYVIHTFRWGEVLPVLGRANLWLLIGAAGALTLIYWLVRAVRLQVLLHAQGVRVPFLRLYLLNTLAVSFATVTPGQAGEMLKIEMLHGGGDVQRMPGYGAFLVERVLDMLLTVLMLGSVILVVPGMLRPVLWFLGAGALGILVLGLVLAFAHRLPAGVGRFFQHIRATVADGRAFVLALLLTLVGWGIITVIWGVTLASVGVFLNGLQALALLSVTTIVNVASLVPGGVGVAEVSASKLLLLFGAGAISAQSGALILRIYSLLLLALGAGHYVVYRSLVSRTQIRKMENKVSAESMR